MHARVEGFKTRRYTASWSCRLWVLLRNYTQRRLILQFHFYAVFSHTLRFSVIVSENEALAFNNENKTNHGNNGWFLYYALKEKSRFININILLYSKKISQLATNIERVTPYTGLSIFFFIFFSHSWTVIATVLRTRIHARARTHIYIGNWHASWFMRHCLSKFCAC